MKAGHFILFNLQLVILLFISYSSCAQIFIGHGEAIQFQDNNTVLYKSGLCLQSRIVGKGVYSIHQDTLSLQFIDVERDNGNSTKIEKIANSDSLVYLSITIKSYDKIRPNDTKVCIGCPIFLSENNIQIKAIVSDFDGQVKIECLWNEYPINIVANSIGSNTECISLDSPGKYNIEFLLIEDNTLYLDSSDSWQYRIISMNNDSLVLQSVAEDKHQETFYRKKM